MTSLVGLDYNCKSCVQAGMSYYRAKHPQAVFLIMSDDTVWCKEHLQGEDVVVVGMESPLSDYTLTMHLLCRGW